MRPQIILAACLVFPAVASAVVACGNAGQPDRMQQVSERCKVEAKKELRDPDSARFGDTEYIVEQRKTNHDTSPPPSEKTYKLVGLVNARNAFGGMGEEQLYTCSVSFDTSGNIIEDTRTRVGNFDKAHFLDRYIARYSESGVSAPVTRSVNPDGTSIK